MMYLNPEGVIDYARTLIGTPYQHQGRLPRIAIDCVGILVAVMRWFNVPHEDYIGYSTQPNETEFRYHLNRNLCFLGTWQQAGLGDVATFAIGGSERHVGIVSRLNPLWVIHAFEVVGKCAEMPIETDIKWCRRLRCAYRFPGLAI